MEFLDKWLAQPAGHANNLDNPDKAARGLFVIGTDTEVGKSYVASLMIRHLVARGVVVGAYKPVASGVPSGQNSSSSSDAEQLWQASGSRWPLERICPQHFTAPVAPPIAARREGRSVDESLLRSGVDWWRSRCEVLVVEGAGGALSPLGDNTTVLDLACDLMYPVVLVAEHRLGMMNHTLLTLEALQRRGLELLALIINHPRSDAAEVAQTVAQPTKQSETLECLMPFCHQIMSGKLSGWLLEHSGSALSPACR